MKVIKLQKSIKTRPISLEEFIAMKKITPFEQFRFMAKSINFGFLFGMVGKTFSDRELVKEWDIKQVEEYILQNKISSDTIESINERFKYQLSIEECKYITVAENIRTKFFNKYSGLEQRIKELRTFLKQNGNVRSYYGAFRKFPLVLFEGDEEDRKERAGYDNIAVNTTIQNFEAVVVMRNIVRISQWLRENNMKSRVFGTVHDSVDFYIEVSEIEVILPKIKSIFERIEPEFHNIPLKIDMKIGDYYKEGKEF